MGVGHPRVTPTLAFWLAALLRVDTVDNAPLPMTQAFDTTHENVGTQVRNSWTFVNVHILVGGGDLSSRVSTGSVDRIDSFCVLPLSWLLLFLTLAHRYSIISPAVTNQAHFVLKVRSKK